MIRWIGGEGRRAEKGREKEKERGERIETTRWKRYIGIPRLFAGRPNYDLYPFSAFYVSDLVFVNHTSFHIFSRSSD